MPGKPIPTTERLAQALEEAKDPALRKMVELARKGHYDDFKSSLAFPLVQLAADLRAAGHPELVQRVITASLMLHPKRPRHGLIVRRDGLPLAN